MRIDTTEWIIDTPCRGGSPICYSKQNQSVPYQQVKDGGWLSQVQQIGNSNPDCLRHTRRLVDDIMSIVLNPMNHKKLIL